MDIEGTIGKLLTPVEKHSTLIGAGLAGLYLYQGGGLMGDITSVFNGQFHFPDFNEMIASSNQDPTLKPAIIMGVAGWLLKDATSNSTLKKAAGIAQGGGLGYAAIVLAGNLLRSMTHSNPAPSGNAGSPSDFRGYS